MTTEIRLPQWGMGMSDGMVARWLKQVGDHVEADEALVEIEAAKVTEVISAPVAGYITSIMVAEGETVPVRTVLAVISDTSESAAAPSAPSRPAVGRPESARRQEVANPSIPIKDESAERVQVTPLARRLARELSVDLGAVKGSGPGGRITDEDVRQAANQASSSAPSTERIQVEPRARRLAKDLGIDVSQVKGSGPGGRITEADVQREAATPSTNASPGGQTLALSGMRAAIARRMHESVQSMAQLTMTTEADVTELAIEREVLRERLKLTYTDLIVKAVAESLKEHPRLNATLDGQEIRLLSDRHIGIAVALDEGLIVPVIRNADTLSLAAISAEVTRLATDARKGSLGPEEVTGSTFTITNLGMYEIDMFTPIINPPEVAILGVGRIVERLARQGDGIAWRKMMTLSLTIDHRVVDGAPGAAFLQAVKRRLESPGDWIDAR